MAITSDSSISERTTPAKSLTWFRTLFVLCISIPLALAGYAVTGALLASSLTSPLEWANVWTTLALYPAMLIALLFVLRLEGKGLSEFVNFERAHLKKDILLGVAIAVLAPVINAIVSFPLNFIVYTPAQLQEFMSTMQSGGFSSAAMPAWFYWFGCSYNPWPLELLRSSCIVAMPCRALPG